MKRQAEPARTLEQYAKAEAPAPEVVINRVALSAVELDALGGGIAPGRYWYDRASGFWGREGSPIEGQTLAGMNLGGPLRADASNGSAGMFINGRELTMLDVMWLTPQGASFPSRIWMDETGAYGEEGGPPLGQITLKGPSQVERGLFSPWS